MFKDDKFDLVLDIPGSSYKIRLVKVEGNWAVELTNGNENLDSVIIPLPNQNSYQIIKNVGFLKQEFIRKAEETKRNHEQNPNQPDELKWK